MGVRVRVQCGIELGGGGCGGGGIVAANRAEPRRQFGVAHALSE